MPSVASLLSMLLFGGVGFVAFRVGLKRSAWGMIAVGVALMAYTYFVDAVWLIWLVGSALCAVLWLVWE